MPGILAVVSPAGIIFLAGLVTAGPAGALIQRQRGEERPPSVPAFPQTCPVPCVPVDTAITIGRLPNGLTYYLRVNRRPAKRAELRLVVKAGSVLESGDQRGLAHFLEHMAFNGTVHFEKHQLVDYLQGLGMRFGADLNASTGPDETVFQLTIPTDTSTVVDRGLQIVEDWMHGLRLDPKEIEAERGVVLEEWRLGRGAGARINEAENAVLYRGTPYATRLPIGLPAVIQGATRDRLARYYREWYRPDLMAVVVVGDFDKTEMEARIRRQFSGVPPATSRRPLPTIAFSHNVTPMVSIVTDPEAAGSETRVIYKLPKTVPGTMAEYRRALVRSLYADLLNERLAELTQRPDAPYLGAWVSFTDLNRAGTATVYGITAREDGIEASLAGSFTEVERAAQHGFTHDEFERGLVAARRNLESALAGRDAVESASHADGLVGHFLTGSPIASIDQADSLSRRLLSTIALSEVNALANAWRGTRDRVILVSLPARRGARIPTAASVLSTLTSVARRSTTAYHDSVGIGPLVGPLPPVGEVVSENMVAAVGVTRWTLSNGIRILLKPTDFNPDQIALVGYGPGGTSLAPESLYVSSALATSVLEVGGLGQYSAVSLQKRLAGRIAGAAVAITDLTEDVQAWGSPKDLETMLQLLYLRFRAPRVDSLAVAAWKQAVKSRLSDRAADPDAAFADTLQVTMTAGHPRSRPLTPAMVDSVDVRRALAFYQDRYADASDFTFIIVGAFDTVTLKPLVERYLGALPSLRRHEAARDIGVRPPRGVVRKTVFAGREPQARTQLVFTGPADFNRERRFVLHGLAEVLSRRLREKLREELGGTYAVGVQGEMSREPYGHYQVTIGFGGPPERIARLTAATFGVIEELKARGASAKELAELGEMQRRTLETNLRRNEFWLSALSLFDQNGWDLAEIPATQPLARILTSEAIAAAAREYLDAGNYVQVTLLPGSVEP